MAGLCECEINTPLGRGPVLTPSGGEDILVYDGGFPSLNVASTQRGNPGPNPGGRTIQTRHTLSNDDRGKGSLADLVEQMQMNFREYKYSDFSELVSMVHALYREDPSSEPITDTKISKTVRELRKNPIRGRIVIFEKDGVTIGYSILIFYWSDEYGGDILHIDELYVKPEYRHRGIATSFFKHVSRAFKDQIVASQLEVTHSNSKAMKYYKKLGFEETVNQHLIHKR